MNIAEKHQLSSALIEAATQITQLENCLKVFTNEVTLNTDLALKKLEAAQRILDAPEFKHDELYLSDVQQCVQK